jgi:hypothetical protein
MDRLWMNQIGRNLTDVVDGILKGKRYLIHDRDPLFTTEFLQTLRRLRCGLSEVAAGIPNLNAHAERFVRTIQDPAWSGCSCSARAPCRKRLPNSSRITRPSATTKVGRRHCSVLTPGHAVIEGKVQRRERLGGLLNYYYRKAA